MGDGESGSDAGSGARAGALARVGWKAPNDMEGPWNTLVIPRMLRHEYGVAPAFVYR